jgi:hypothetical protein
MLKYVSIKKISMNTEAPNHLVDTLRAPTAQREYVPNVLNKIPHETLKVLENAGVQLKLAPNGWLQLTPPQGYSCDINGRLSPSIQLFNTVQSISVVKHTPGLLVLALDGWRDYVTFFTPMNRILDIHQYFFNSIRAQWYQSSVTMNKDGIPVMQIQVPAGTYTQLDTRGQVLGKTPKTHGILEVDAYSNFHISRWINGITVISVVDMRTWWKNVWESLPGPTFFDTRQPNQGIDTMIQNMQANLQDKNWMIQNFDQIVMAWGYLFPEQRQRFIDLCITPFLVRNPGTIVSMGPVQLGNMPALRVDIAPVKIPKQGHQSISHMITRQNIHQYASFR